MSKKKNKKIDKETRQLIEGISDLLKKKGDRYKFKSGNKKTIRKVKKTCVHYIIRKGKPHPTVTQDPTRSGYWKCQLCKQSFSIKPLNDNEYLKRAENFLEDINQLQFYSLDLGGDGEDTRLFVQLKQLVPKYIKVQKNLLKAINKKSKFEDAKRNSDIMDPFANYNTGYNYRI